MGQDKKKLRQCLTTTKAQMVMKELHGPLGGHSAMEITQREDIGC
jgi:hypothetical protein